MKDMAGMPGMSGQGASTGDSPAGHTMVVVGAGPIFCSHKPMFMKPHDFQVILHASFSDHGSDLGSFYVGDRTAHPNIVTYTLAPNPFVLSDLLDPAPGQPAKLRSFHADLFRGDFEKPDQDTGKVAANVVVTVEHVVVNHRFKPNASPLDHLGYVLFGQGSELWLAHVITAKPSFDQLLSTTVSGHRFTDQELAAGIPVTIADRKDVAGERLVAATPSAGQATVANAIVSVELHPQREFYFNNDSDLT